MDVTQEEYDIERGKNNDETKNKRGEIIQQGSGSNEGATIGKQVSGKQLSMVKEQTWIEKFAALLAIAAVTTSILSMVMAGGYIVRSASILILILSPYSYYQQTRITDIKALKETYGVLKGQVDRIAGENENLLSTVDRMKGRVDNLEDLENVLDAITESEGNSIESLKESVEMNRQNVERLENNVKSAVLQNILSVVFSADTNDDYKLSNQETAVLIQRLRNVNGVKVDEKKFRQVVKRKEGSLRSVMDIIENVVHAGEDTELSVFSFIE